MANDMGFVSCVLFLKHAWHLSASLIAAILNFFVELMKLYKVDHVSPVLITLL